jgi:hypothetical protein
MDKNGSVTFAQSFTGSAFQPYFRYLTSKNKRTVSPNYAPEWTNYNPSDPGITLIEMFAYLTEMLLYRQNRITDDNLRTFLRLLNGPDWFAEENRLFGLCYAIDGGYKGWNPYIEKHLAIFVNCF